ncbi:hypothetical protein KVV02_008495 [Mortierella alpina]|uniref:Uncharacterized protein n=1 Tax=Mortierella alpina TaxID=64518 RepID=A0A9P8A5Y9_MORAP|nr:hypothetical protein KVV02_008495 [Mortierella alpina]
MTTTNPRISLGYNPSSDVATAAIRVSGAANIKPSLDTIYAHSHSDIGTVRVYGNGDTEHCPLGSFSIAIKVRRVSAGAHQPENLKWGLSRVEKSKRFACTHPTLLPPGKSLAQPWMIFTRKGCLICRRS